MQELSKRYPLWLCDVWGVIHDGHQNFATAVEALRRHREAGGWVVLVTNAPRVSGEIERHLARLNVERSAFDAIVTSGEVTRRLIERHKGRTIYHVGPAHDVSVLSGIDVRVGSVAEADAVVCIGLRDDRKETPEDYESLLDELRARDLEMICANPDKVVRAGDRLIYCAGALAERYALKGGRVVMAGKPYAPIFDLAIAEAAKIADRQFKKSEILMIGDGPETDIKGAADYGLDCLLITGGIMQGENAGSEGVARTRRAVPHARIVASQPRLSW